MGEAAVDKFQTALQAYMKKDYATARTLWTESANEDNDQQAMTNLGTIYAKGEGIPKDHAQARYWFEKAAELGNASAAFNLAVQYENGLGCEKDIDKAVRWYETAAEKGHSGAQYQLGVLFLGSGLVPVDAKRGMHWMIAALDAGNGRAKMRLGIFDEESMKVNTDLPKNERFRNLEYDVMMKELDDVLTEKVRPMLRQDGGDINLVDIVVDNPVIDVRLQYVGACSGCSLASTATLSAIRVAVHAHIDPAVRVFAI